MKKKLLATVFMASTVLMSACGGNALNGDTAGTDSSASTSSSSASTENKESERDQALRNYNHYIDAVYEAGVNQSAQTWNNILDNVLPKYSDTLTEGVSYSAMMETVEAMPEDKAQDFADNLIAAWPNAKYWDLSDLTTPEKAVLVTVMVNTEMGLNQQPTTTTNYKPTENTIVKLEGDSMSITNLESVQTVVSSSEVIINEDTTSGQLDFKRVNGEWKIDGKAFYEDFISQYTSQSGQ